MTASPPPSTDPCKPTTPPAPGDSTKCKPLAAAPEAPKLPDSKVCPQPCQCPTPPGGTPTDCLDILIKDQATRVKQAVRAKEFVDELTAIQGEVASAQADYTQARYKDLLKIWQDQDKLIADLVQKLVCAVPCWECLLECRLCPELTDIRKLEDELNGTGALTKDVFSLIDLQFWHQRNVTQMQARVYRIKLVLSAWEKPSGTLGDVLDKNGKLIEDTQKIIATDSAKAVYDVFMTLLPRHWAIRPRKVASSIQDKFVKICKCDDGTPDDCCGPDVGIVSLRNRLLGPLPYIVDPADFPGIICCVATERLAPASDQLAAAQAALAATTSLIEQKTKQIADKTSNIETSFKAELGNPIDCGQYKKKDPPPTAPPPPPPAPPDGSYQGDTEQPDQTAR
ncbi:hypothetical protein [Bradyrhizobium sp. S3.2.12]|uniref:hypothetical protein n=1 Tax=Bradyrhizobium sp. S3.2.12 TaxID=3156387 RepID=UPI0033927EB2